MSDVLRGNFKPRNPVKVDENEEKSLEEQFEKAALKRLGGSIAFVSKRKVVWNDDGDESQSQPPAMPKK